jgi:hypothetical protein
VDFSFRGLSSCKKVSSCNIPAPEEIAVHNEEPMKNDSSHKTLSKETRFAEEEDPSWVPHYELLFLQGPSVQARVQQNPMLDP